MRVLQRMKFGPDKESTCRPLTHLDLLRYPLSQFTPVPYRRRQILQFLYRNGCCEMLYWPENAWIL